MQKDLTWSDFAKIKMCVGTITEASVFEDAKKPAYVIKADFGPYGILKTSAQVTAIYQPEDLIGKQIVGVLNFPTKQIATIQSEFLLLGAIGDQNEVTVLTPDLPVKNGLSIG